MVAKATSRLSTRIPRTSTASSRQSRPSLARKQSPLIRRRIARICSNLSAGPRRRRRQTHRRQRRANADEDRKARSSLHGSWPSVTDADRSHVDAHRERLRLLGGYGDEVESFLAALLCDLGYQSDIECVVFVTDTAWLQWCRFP